MIRSPGVLGGGDGGQDHTAGPERGRAAAGSGAERGCTGSTSHAGAGDGLGRLLARGGCRTGRHGPADAARLVAPLQRRGACGTVGSAASRTQAAAQRGTDESIRGDRPGRPRSGDRQGRALAPGRSASGPEGAVRDRDPRAHGGQASGSARAAPPVGAPAAPSRRRGGAGGFQKKFAELVKQALPARAVGKPIEIWFQDEARVGQQGTLTRVWAKRGTRPRAPRDRRYAWAYLFGAVCPERAVGAGLVLPFANAEAMNLHLQEVSRYVAPGAHAVLVLDGAGWHGLAALGELPHNLTLLSLPRYSPELNPVENQPAGLARLPG